MRAARIVRTAAASAFLALLAGACQGAPSVRLGQGELIGVADGDVVVYRGIPYAAPPVGALRWRPPGPPPAWTGTRTADAFGPVCMQPSSRPAAGMSEDCLTLNIWAPAAPPAGGKAPVMVWIHGGAFVWGAGSAPFYDGTHFAERGVIVVTINYRLGRFGFFAHPALTAQAGGEAVGDYGLMDQIAALRWVRDNIAAFGGDPANVTIAGESAGAISVNYLMVSPAAKGLFAKAISESGFGRVVGQALAGAPDAAEAVGERFAATLGVKGADAAAAAALRALPADKLNTAPSGLADPEIARPIIDGKIIPEAVPVAFAAGHEARVPYLEGGNSYEASLFPNVRKDPEPTLAAAGPDRAELVALYGGAADLGKVAADVMTDAMVTEPARYLAAAATRDGEPVYVYHFAYVPAALRGDEPGAAHGAEILYVFDNLPAAPVPFGGRVFPAATSADRRLAEAMNAYWARFMTDGSPGSAGGEPWPHWSEADQAVMVFGPDGPEPTADFEKARLDFLTAHARPQGK